MSDDPVLVVWWRDPSAGSEIPRRHGVGWSVVDGGRHGTLVIESLHLRLPARTIETEITIRLGGEMTNGVRVTHVDQSPVPVDPAVRLRADGYPVHERDLAYAYGDDAVAGVTAELRGRGIWAVVVIADDLTAPVRVSALAWAREAIDQFTQATAAELDDIGWTRRTDTRWQIIARRA